MVVVNDEGRIILVNARTEALFGYRQDELLGQRVERLVPARRGGWAKIYNGHFQRFFKAFIDDGRVDLCVQITCHDAQRRRT